MPEDIGRAIALDVGDVRIGVAVSDPLGIIAQAHDVIQRRDTATDVEAVKAIVDGMGANKIVVGMPLNLQGQQGPQAQKVLAFIEALQAAVDVEIVTQDERFSTVSAERSLIQANVRRKKRKKVIDKVAAQQILQVYLDRQSAQKRNPNP